MRPRLTYAILFVALSGTAAFAIFHADKSQAASAHPPHLPETVGADPSPIGLPPGHPPVGALGQDREVPSATDPPSVTWRVPAGWTALANPNAMRIATYRLPRAPGDAEDSDISITRAGGTTEANIERWMGQFDDRGKDIRSERTVHGCKVTVVEVTGTYLGGGMMGGASTRRPGWALLGAIVEASGSPYFFKATGPAATIHSSRASFAALLDSITPS